jgi:hypothetical protein
VLADCSATQRRGSAGSASKARSSIEPKVGDYVGRSLMLVTALSPHIGYKRPPRSLTRPNSLTLGSVREEGNLARPRSRAECRRARSALRCMLGRSESARGPLALLLFACTVASRLGARRQ